MATIPYGKLIQQVLGKYPIKNSCWSYSETTDHFVTEDSALTHGGLLDPWNRPMASRKNWHPSRDREGEITSWTTLTTVDGVHIELTVLND